MNALFIIIIPEVLIALHNHFLLSENHFYILEQGQATEAIDKSDKQKNILKIRQFFSSYTEQGQTVHRS